VFLGSADWMPRNFFRRIELMFPVEDARLKARLINELLPIILKDNVKARQLSADGSYVRGEPAQGEEAIRSQAVFQTLARASARVAVDSALRFVPIFGSGGPPPPDAALANGDDAGQRATPPPVRSPRSRKRTAAT
jgi:Polyphosphate kinase C-terminal domain 2